MGFLEQFKKLTRKAINPLLRKKDLEGVKFGKRPEMAYLKIPAMKRISICHSKRDLEYRKFRKRKNKIANLSRKINYGII